MHIVISNTIEAPIYLQIVNQIKAAVLSGELREGEGLPSIRGLAAALKISVITTKRAYEELEKDGFIESVQGKGSFVTGKNKELMKEEQFKKIEECLQEAVDMARIAHIRCEELKDVLAAMYDEG